MFWRIGQLVESPETPPFFGAAHGFGRRARAVAAKTRTISPVAACARENQLASIAAGEVGANVVTLLLYVTVRVADSTQVDGPEPTQKSETSARFGGWASTYDSDMMRFRA